MDRLQKHGKTLEEEMPELLKAFRQLHHAAAGDGALTAREKELILVGISVAIRCEPCIRAHVATAREMGISREEIIEAAGVAVLMGGGPSVAYTNHYLFDALDG